MRSASPHDRCFRSILSAIPSSPRRARAPSLIALARPRAGARASNGNRPRGGSPRVSCDNSPPRVLPPSLRPTPTHWNIPRCSSRSSSASSRVSTEFLPISSTGHLIVAGSLLGYTGDHAKVFEIVIQAGAILAVCWEFRIRLARVLAGLSGDRSRSASRSTSRSRSCRPRCSACCSARRSRRCCSRRFPSRWRSVAGALVILWVERRQRTRPACRAHRRRRRDALDRRAEGRPGAGVRADPRHVALGRDDHRRHAVRPFAQGGDRVLVLPRDPHALRRVRLRDRQESRAARRPPTCRRSAWASPPRSSPRSCACAG